MEYYLMPYLKTLSLFLFLIVLQSSCAPINNDTNSRILSVTPVKQDASWAEDWWEKRHNEKVLLAKNTEIDLLMVGDSITHLWESKGASVWEQFYEPRKAFNLGFSGDRTEHVLWRIRNGALDNMSPKLTVLMIGTNNTGHRKEPAEHTVKGIKEILSEFRTRLPGSKVLLLGIFPRHNTPNSEMRMRNDEINLLISKLNDDDMIYYLDINEVFLDDNNLPRKELMPDLLHPNSLGYSKWAEAMEPTILRLMY